jgi:translocation and assembly module TamA
MKLFIQRAVMVCFLLACSRLPAAEELPVLKYKAEISGEGSGAVAKAVKESALTFTLIDRPPTTLGQLRRRVDKDLSRIRKIMESRGYYDGTVTPAIKQDPVRVIFKLEPGPQYRFGRVDLVFLKTAGPAPGKIVTQLQRDRPAVAQQVFDEQQRILGLLQQKGFPFPRLVKRSVDLDRKQQRVNLVLEFDPGAFATFGPLQVSGLESLKTNYVQRQLPWKPGEKYDVRLLSDFESKLLATGLFSAARVEPDPPISGSDATPVNITLTERDLRTIRLGVGYSDVGPNAKAIWEHRNLFGNGENFETTLSYSPIELLAEATLERPGFLRANQSLVLDLNASRETPDAYDTDKLSAGMLVKRNLTRHIMGGTGLRYKHSRVEQLQEEEIFNYMIFPFIVNLDYRNDRLNPVRGGQLFVSPSFYKNLDASASFLKTGIEARLYKMLWKTPRLSGATRLTLGSVAGATTEQIPADERYYAGGGGSIRGYEYQAVGPQLDGDPVGGTHLLEFSAELRIQPGSKLGYVVFVDGGTVYENLSEDVGRSLRYGAGLGVRWFTGIGPLRADLAYPLNADDDQAERLQFYISLGQAF